jgi:hypothetical protein
MQRRAARACPLRNRIGPRPFEVSARSNDEGAINDEGSENEARPIVVKD